MPMQHAAVDNVIGKTVDMPTEDEIVQTETKSLRDSAHTVGYEASPFATKDSAQTNRASRTVSETRSGAAQFGKPCCSLVLVTFE